MQTIRTLSLIAAGELFVASLANGQTWMQTSAPSNYWNCVASSADGTKLAAGIGGFNNSSGSIYVSSDSGMTWAQTSAPTNSWTSIASSADGNTLFAVAAASYDYVYSSTNLGTNWNTTHIYTPSPHYSQHCWPQIACSADGSKAAAVYYGAIYITTNSGATWSLDSLPPLPPVAWIDWYSVIASPDGSHFVASGRFPQGTFNYVSTYTTNSWTTNAAFASVRACSVDGSIQMGTPFNQDNYNLCPVFFSTDSGTTWNTNLFSPPYPGVGGFALSADGTRMIITMGAGTIYTSTNSGASWITNGMFTQNSTNDNRIFWTGVAMSADGGRIVAVSIPGGSTNSGFIYTLQTTPTPLLNITQTNGNLGLSWIVPSTNFVLQQSADMSDWTDLTNIPTLNLNNLQDQIILPLPSDSAFYRLETP